MTSSSETNLSTSSEDDHDSLRKGPGVRCVYTLYTSSREDSDGSPAETFEYTVNEPENDISNGCEGALPTQTNSADSTADEDIEKQATPPHVDHQEDLLEQIKMQMQEQIDGLKGDANTSVTSVTSISDVSNIQDDTLLKGILEIKDTQREIQRDLVRLKGMYSLIILKEILEIKDTQWEIQRDLVRLKGSDNDGDGGVSALHYEPYQRRAQYTVRPLSPQSTLSVDTQTPDSWEVEPDTDVVNTNL